MQELDKIQRGLADSNILLLKFRENGVECSFVKEGLVSENVFIQDPVLAEALSSKSLNGIIEGDSLRMLKNDYSWFTLRVKTRRLYKQLQHA